MINGSRWLRGFWGAGLLGVAVAGCAAAAEPVVEPMPMFTEGTRLKAVYQEVDGAPPYFLNWYDTELGVDCAFRDVGLTDQLVCFPFGRFAYDAFAFADSACQEPLVKSLPLCEAPRFFARWPSFEEPCGATAQLFELGEAVPNEPGSLFGLDTSGDEACRAKGPPSPGQTVDELHRLGREIPLDELVTGTYRHESGPGRILPVSIVASDGSVQAGGGTTKYDTGSEHVAWDSERHELVSTALSRGHWYPAVQYWAGVFSDAECTQPAAVGPSCGGRAANEAFVWSADASLEGEPQEFFELGAPVAHPTRDYYWDDERCLLDGGSESPVTNPSLSTFAIGAPVPSSAFALASDILTGTGQVQLVREGTSDGPPASATGFFDTALGHACSASPAADGRVRCLPPAAQADLFADVACSVPVLMLSQKVDARHPAPAFASRGEPIEGQAAGCYDLASPRTHIYPVSERRYDGPVFARVGDTCVNRLATSDFGDTIPFFSTGPEIPANEFARVRQVRPSAG